MMRATCGAQLKDRKRTKGIRLLLNFGAAMASSV